MSDDMRSVPASKRDATDWPPPGVDLSGIQAACRELAAHIKPVLEIEEGSAGARQTGSAFILRNDREAVLVTAHHVVNGPTTKRVVIHGSQTVRWPAAYKIVVARDSELPDADIAYAFGHVTPRSDGWIEGIALDRLPASADTEPGTSFIAIGYPRSKSKIRMADTSLRNALYFVSGHGVDASTYTRLALNRRVHIAIGYDPAQVRGFDGRPLRGSDPHGMSGGLLCVPIEERRGSETRVQLLVAGVLTEYHAAPDSVLVAARIDCLADALAPGRPEPDRTHRAADAGDT